MAEIQDVCVIKAEEWYHGGWQAFVAVVEVSLDSMQLFTLSIFLCRFSTDGTVRDPAGADNCHLCLLAITI